MKRELKVEKTSGLLCWGCTSWMCSLSNKGDYKGWFVHAMVRIMICQENQKRSAPKNMEIPKYEFVDANTIKIG